MRGALLAVAMATVILQGASAQSIGKPGEDASLTYTTGQAVVPIFHGWRQNPDGTSDLYFSYINRNWQEHVDIPIGANNFVSAGFGPDAGQPTHFFPRINRWQFAVRVPKDFGDKEVVWTLITRGETIRAYGSLNPGYAIDDFLIQHEFGNSEVGHKWPVLTVEGAKQRTAKVGQPVQLVATAIDPNPVNERGRGRGGAGRRGTGGPPQLPAAEIRAGSVGGDFTRSTARGLRVAWFVYRGPAERAAAVPVFDSVVFDPPMFKVWEDQRGGSPWSPNFQVPPIPPGNKWVHTATFKVPGVYVLRAQAHDGYLFDNEDITFTVTQ